MRLGLVIITIFLSQGIWGQANKTLSYGFADNTYHSLNEEVVFEFDGVFPNQKFSCISLRSSENKLIAYKANITTAVCDDTLCQIVECTIYWDITGKYLGYNIYDNKPLTKFDHQAFSSSDYEKLHHLLNDRHSVLSQKRKEEILDKSIKIKSDKYDAITGATAIELKEVVVAKASYTSYTLWYIANGQIVEKIRKHTDKNISRNQTIDLLDSKNNREQLLALKHLGPEDFKEQFTKILGILETAIPLNRQFVLTSLPQDVWEKSENQISICLIANRFDSRSISILLKKLKAIKKPAIEALLALSKITKNFSRKQLNDYRQLVRSPQ